MLNFTSVSLQAFKARAKKLTREKNEERILREKVPPSFSPHIIRPDELGQTFCSLSDYASLVKRRAPAMRPDEIPFEVRRSRRISKESLSRRIMRLVPIFILETHNQTNYKCLPKFVQTDDASLV